MKNRSDTKRDQILTVAGQLFTAHGYNAVTMEAIAEAAPVSKPTLYNHFDSKAALFFAVMQTRTDLIFKMIESELRTERTLEDNLKNMAHSFLNAIMKPESVKMYRIMVAESANFPELGQIFYESGPRKICGLIAECLEKEHQAGRLNVPNPSLSANFFINMLKGNGHMQCLLAIKNKIPPKELAEIIDYAVSVFIKGHSK